jgi:hypothetical protein
LNLSAKFSENYHSTAQHSTAPKTKQHRQVKFLKINFNQGKARQGKARQGQIFIKIFQDFSRFFEDLKKNFNF